MTTPPDANRAKRYAHAVVVESLRQEIDLLSKTVKYAGLDERTAELLSDEYERIIEYHKKRAGVEWERMRQW